MHAEGRSATVARPLGVALGAAAVVFGITEIIRNTSNLPYGYFTRDPAAITGAHEYVGMVSIIGLFGWCVAAVSMAFAAYVSRLRGAVDRGLPYAVGSVTIAYLAIDDAFQLHESAYPSLGIDEHLVEPVYMLLALALIVTGRRFISTTNVRLLWTAGAFFSLAVLLDLVTENIRYVGLEDAAKLLGIFTLTAYCAQAAAAEARALAAMSRATA